MPSYEQCRSRWQINLSVVNSACEGRCKDGEFIRALCPQYSWAPFSPLQLSHRQCSTEEFCGWLMETLVPHQVWLTALENLPTANHNKTVDLMATSASASPRSLHLMSSSLVAQPAASLTTSDSWRGSSGDTLSASIGQLAGGLNYLN